MTKHKEKEEDMIEHKNMEKETANELIDIEKKEVTRYPEPIVGALIMDREEKILLSRGKKWGGKYTIFGGHVELGEDLRSAAKREVKEEAGLDVEVVAELRFGESVFDRSFHKKKHFIYLDFLCRYDGDGDAVKTNGEYEDGFRWFSIEEALKLDLGGGSRDIIEAYLRYKEQQESLGGWKRCLADFENYKKRQADAQKGFFQFASETMIMNILPVIDNFHASTDHIPEDQKNNPWVVGIMHIQKQLEQVIKDGGVEEIAVKEGDEFTPHLHEAITNGSASSADKQETITKEKKNKITKVLSKGYKMGDKVIRPARVTVG